MKADRRVLARDAAFAVFLALGLVPFAGGPPVQAETIRMAANPERPAPRLAPVQRTSTEALQKARLPATRARPPVIRIAQRDERPLCWLGWCRDSFPLILGIGY